MFITSHHYRKITIIILVKWADVQVSVTKECIMIKN